MSNHIQVEADKYPYGDSYTGAFTITAEDNGIDVIVNTQRKSVEIHLDLPIMREVFGKAGDALREFDANADPSDSGDEDMNTYSSESDSGKVDEEDDEEEE